MCVVRGYGEKTKTEVEGVMGKAIIFFQNKKKKKLNSSINVC
jgi:hypothetical protein